MVTVTPEVKRIIVLIKGIFKQSNILIPYGGQINPLSKVGDKKKWKYDQKKEKKKKISEEINNNIENFNPFSKTEEFFPSKLNSPL